MRLPALVALLLIAPALLATESSKRVIAFAQDTLANDFRRAQVMAVREAVAAHPDVEFRYSDARGEVARLVRDIEKFARDRVDLLVVGTNDAEAVVPVISEVYHSGIPVIILDRGIRGDAYTTFVNSDNRLIGALGGEAIAERLQGKGRVLLFEGLAKADVTQLRTQGFLQVMEKFPEIEVIRRTGNYLRRDAVLEMEKLVAEGVHLDAIFSESDSMLSGVRMVWKQMGIDPASVVTIGCDYTSEAREAILQGTQTASVRFPLGGEETVAIAMRILSGEKVEKHHVIPVSLITLEAAEETPAIF